VSSCVGRRDTPTQTQKKHDFKRQIKRVPNMKKTQKKHDTKNKQHSNTKQTQTPKIPNMIQNHEQKKNMSPTN
jgi:hypothetical protein